MLSLADPSAFFKMKGTFERKFGHTFCIEHLETNGPLLAEIQNFNIKACHAAIRLFASTRPLHSLALLIKHRAAFIARGPKLKICLLILTLSTK